MTSFWHFYCTYQSSRLQSSDFFILMIFSCRVSLTFSPLFRRKMWGERIILFPPLPSACSPDWGISWAWRLSFDPKFIGLPLGEALILHLSLTVGTYNCVAEKDHFKNQSGGMNRNNCLLLKTRASILDLILSLWSSELKMPNIELLLQNVSKWWTKICQTILL